MSTKTPGNLKGNYLWSLWLNYNMWLCCAFVSILFMCVFFCVLQLFVIAFDNGEPVKSNTTLVEITVLQPSRIPIFNQEEYRYILMVKLSTEDFFFVSPRQWNVVNKLLLGGLPSALHHWVHALFSFPNSLVNYCVGLLQTTLKVTFPHIIVKTISSCTLLYIQHSWRWPQHLFRFPSKQGFPVRFIKCVFWQD